jgi:hypothetical protein
MTAIAIAVTTTKQLMQFIPVLTPELLAEPDIASRIASYTLDSLSKRCDPEENFTNAMVTAVDPADQPFATEVRDWIYRHLGVEPSAVKPVEVELAE